MEDGETGKLVAEGGRSLNESHRGEVGEGGWGRGATLEAEGLTDEAELQLSEG